jgi:hypothetical protein
MNTHRLAQILLSMDAGATWSCLVLLAAAWRERSTEPDAPALEPWPVTPASDPWHDTAAEPSWEPVLEDTAPPPRRSPLPPEWPMWNRPTSALPRLETRRALHPRNMAPAAAQPRYIEMVLTRRAG